MAIGQNIVRGGSNIGRGGGKTKFSGQAKVPPVVIGRGIEKKQNIKKQKELKHDTRIGGFSAKNGKGEVNLLHMHHNTEDDLGNKVTRIINTRGGR